LQLKGSSTFPHKRKSGLILKLLWRMLNSLRPLWRARILGLNPECEVKGMAFT